MRSNLYSGNTIIIGATTSCIIALTWAGVKFPWSSFHVLLPLIVGLVGLLLAVLYERFWSKNPSVCDVFQSRTHANVWKDSILYIVEPYEQQWVNEVAFVSWQKLLIALQRYFSSFVHGLVITIVTCESTLLLRRAGLI
jgi:hypothetical protein